MASKNGTLCETKFNHVVTTLRREVQNNGQLNDTPGKVVGAQRLLHHGSPLR